MWFIRKAAADIADAAVDMEEEDNDEANKTSRKDETTADKQKEPTEADVYSFEVDPAQVISHQFRVCHSI